MGEIQLLGLRQLSLVGANFLLAHGRVSTSIYLHGLAKSYTEVSKSEALSLAELEGSPYLNGLTSLADDSAEVLSRHVGDLFLDGLENISEAVALAFSRHAGTISLGWIPDMEQPVASALARHNGKLSLSSEAKNMQIPANPSQKLAMSDEKLFIDGACHIFADELATAFLSKQYRLCYLESEQWIQYLDHDEESPFPRRVVHVLAFTEGLVIDANGVKQADEYLKAYESKREEWRDNMRYFEKTSFRECFA
ncbi:MAG: hypothetical protein NTW21_33270 [Verrucomicrobia bacterium]|nr:hypothetical protein [Verrucomicrobiota bacterium]